MNAFAANVSDEEITSEISDELVGGAGVAIAMLPRDRPIQPLLRIRMLHVRCSGLTQTASSSQITIVYADSVGERAFPLKIECQIVRTEKKAGVVFLWM